MLPTMYTLLAILISLLNFTTAHTWIEQMSLISSNGTYTGAYGYPRGYIGRTDPGFVSQSYLIPELDTGRTRVNSTDLLCPPNQRSQIQPANYPRLAVAPGSAVAFKYLENGHVSLPQNQPGKPPMGGTVFMFGTTQPYDDETIVDVLQWTKDGKGGDGRGYLLGANNYDDGRCRQINGGTISLQRQQEFPNPIPGQPGTNVEIWCENDLVLPTDSSIVPVGKTLTIYWLWQWPTAPATYGLPDGKDEYYSTCADFDVVAKAQEGPIANLLAQQDPNTAAVSGWLSRSAITPTPNVALATDITWPTSSWATTVPSVTSSADTSIITSLAALIRSTADPVTTSIVEATSTSTFISTIPIPDTSTLPYTTYKMTAPISATPTSSTTSALATSSNSLDGMLVGVNGIPISSIGYGYDSSYTSSYGYSSSFGFSTVIISTSSYPSTSTSSSVPASTTSFSFTSTSATSSALTSTTGPATAMATTIATSTNPLARILGAAISSTPTTATSADNTVVSHHHEASASASISASTTTDAPITLTALVTVVATLAPGELMLVVEGKHVVTFRAPEATSGAQAAATGF